MATIDNLRLDTNTISTTDTNGDLTLAPNGTGKVVYSPGTASTVPYLDANKKITSSAVTPTELGYVSGVTSAIQTQLDAKASSSSLSSHEADTTGVHGIADTSQLATLTDLSTHEADTTSVHGIADTTALLKKDLSGVTGTLPLANGGTGQTSKTAAFDALSPMSASGDIIYGGTSGTGTRLAKGSDGDVLTLSSGIPSWAPAASASYASQADMEAGTSNTVAVTPGRAQYHPSAAKAWIKFNGSGTVAIDASYNVTSLTDNGTGSYSVNLTTAMSSGNLCAVSMPRLGGGTNHICGLNKDVANSASSPRFYTVVITSPNTTADMDDIRIAFFGDQ